MSTPQKNKQAEEGQPSPDQQTEFMEMAIHELRTPLTVMNLKTEMLLSGFEGKLSKNQEEALRDIDYYNKRMATILSNILSVLRIDGNAYEFDSETVSLETLLREVITEHEPLAQKKNLSLDASKIGHGLVVTGDPKFLKIILENTLSNSIRYTDEGGNVTVHTKKEEGAMQIFIKDTGRGIPDTEKNKVFLKMYRGSNVSRDSEGTGLGLYITKKLTELSGGTISFSSKEGEGTIFTLSFPTT